MTLARIKMPEPCQFNRDVHVDFTTIWREIDRMATNLSNSVTTFKRHPSYDSRANLLARANELSGAFHLALKLNGYRESPTDTRDLVQQARQAVESLYKSKPST